MSALRTTASSTSFLRGRNLAWSDVLPRGSGRRPTGPTPSAVSSSVCKHCRGFNPTLSKFCSPSCKTAWEDGILAEAKASSDIHILTLAARISAARQRRKDNAAAKAAKAAKLADEAAAERARANKVRAELLDQQDRRERLRYMPRQLVPPELLGEWTAMQADTAKLREEGEREHARRVADYKAWEERMARAEAARRDRAIERKLDKQLKIDDEVLARRTVTCIHCGIKYIPDEKSVGSHCGRCASVKEPVRDA